MPSRHNLCQTQLTMTLDPSIKKSHSHCGITYASWHFAIRELREVSISPGQVVLGTIPSRLPPLLWCVLVVLCLGTRWDLFGVLVGLQFASHRECLLLLLAIRIYLPGESHPLYRILWGVCRYLSWHTGSVHSMPGTWVASWPVLGALDLVW